MRLTNSESRIRGDRIFLVRIGLPCLKLSPLNLIFSPTIHKIMQKHLQIASLLILIGVAISPTLAKEIPLALGFDYPVGGVNGKEFYVSSGFQFGRRTAEIWEGIGGGDTDLGEPVYSIGEGVVVMSQDCGGKWGGVVIVRHRFKDHDGKMKFVDSLYAHKFAGTGYLLNIVLANTFLPAP